ncbi:MAG TPA: methylated-DNA--[protein]-cysteine S-methyltransferase, partial [Gemmatimonadaceae bacterium]
EADRAATSARLRQRFPDALESTTPVDVLLAIGRIVALLRGERVDLTPVALDLETVPAFDRDVYVAARAIPPGATRTYGEIAKQIGQPNASREVGAALARNPFAIVVPCHRVVAANGKMGGFSAGGGVKTKLKLLAIEGGAGPLFDQTSTL